MSNFKITDAPELDKLLFSSLLCELNGYKESVHQIRPKMQLLTISRASVQIPSTLSTISVTDSKYGPAVISTDLFSKNYTFTEDFSINNFCGKTSSIQKYLNWPINSNN